MKIKQLLLGAVLGIITGVILTIGLIILGLKTDIPVFGAHIFIVRLYVFVICLLSAIVTEAGADKIFVDTVLSLIVNMFTINENVLIWEDPQESWWNVFIPVGMVVIMAALISNPIKRWGSNFLNKEVEKKKE